MNHTAKFKGGDKVRCICTDWNHRITGDPIDSSDICPVYHGIYTVDCYEEDRNIILVEIPYDQGDFTIAWGEEHFERATETGREIMIHAKARLKELILN